MRGKPIRNIPAYAGKTVSSLDFRPQRSEHPRIRGENRHMGIQTFTNFGTSPHTRGKPCSTPVLLYAFRNIPAYAGKTKLFANLWNDFSEHPRIRGENFSLTDSAVSKLGTSPHTRGKHLQSLGRGDAAWNIPAYAGKTSNIIGRRSGAAEHPRIRGENAFWCPRRRLGRGTSPHTRGKRSWAYREIRHHGTSPHTRGKHVIFLVEWWIFRNIPAYAGKTSSKNPPVYRSWEHPRIRGENTSSNVFPHPKAGTSPHTRGKPHL